MGSQRLYQKQDNHEPEGVAATRRSKLENYETIMKALVDRYLSVDSLAFNCGMDCVAVNERLGFLIGNGLVEEKKCHNKTLYALTRRGLAVQKALALTQRLDELKTTVKAVNEELVVMKFSDDGEKHPTGDKTKTIKRQ